MKVLGKDISLLKKSLPACIKKSVSSAGFKRVILGLSGGLDSSLSAYLAVLALGRNGVVGVKMPHSNISNPLSAMHADLVIKELGIKSYHIDIAPMVDSYFKAFPGADKLRIGNKMARERMSVLYDLSRVEKALVMGTGNRTEILLGYFTLHGDAACDINALSGLYKTHVRALAAELLVPKEIIDKVPSADLWEGQTDEGELGVTYEEVDRLLYYMIDKKLDQAKLVKQGFGREFIKKVKDRIKATEYKRVGVATPVSMSF